MSRLRFAWANLMKKAPQVSKTLTFEQLKALADFCNKRIADIEAAKLSERLYHE